MVLMTLRRFAANVFVSSHKFIMEPQAAATYSRILHHFCCEAEPKINFDDDPSIDYIYYLLN